MCLITVAYRYHPRYKMVIAANRDEFYDRPTSSARFWQDCPDALCGRDLVAGGTWLGVTRSGRFGALTNYRDPSLLSDSRRSRGHVVSDFLCGNLPPSAYTASLTKAGAKFNGFNLLAGDTESLWYYSNITGVVQQLTPGIYGLSNHLLDTPWPKVERCKEKVARCLRADLIDTEELLLVLSDSVPAFDSELPCTGVGLEWERILSSIFIASEIYGTRSSTVITVDLAGTVCFTERTYLPLTGRCQDSSYTFLIKQTQ